MPKDIEHCNYDIPSAFDFQPLIDAVKGVCTVELPGYDYVNHCSIPNCHTYDPNVDFVIIEGIMHLSNNEIC